MPVKIKPKALEDVTEQLRKLYLRTERELVNTIMSKRRLGYVDYVEVAALERVQAILESMIDEAWTYVPKMVEKVFYRGEAAAAGYRNARTLSAAQLDVMQLLSNNLLGEIEEAAQTARRTAEEIFTIGRLEQGSEFRASALQQVMRGEALGGSLQKSAAQMIRDLQNKGITAFVDKAGREWTLYEYCSMATRTTARQAEIATILTRDPEQDLFKISKVGSTCPVCAPLEGRVYSRSGTNPDYPPLSLAFGKIDPDGSDDLSNTYLNIHPNCLHVLMPYTTIDKSKEQIEKDKAFSDPKKNPINRDPRTNKQIEAYREKQRNRQRLLKEKREKKQSDFENARNKDIMISGARITNPESGRAEEFAEMYYKEIRSFSTDVKKIAKNTGYKESQIRKIKNYLFLDKAYYNPRTKQNERFAPDCAIAQSWQRLMLGEKHIKQHDLTLINHELYEMKLKKNHPDWSHQKAHNTAELKYNYQMESNKYYANLRKHKKNSN